jgi:C1A family cysteine protease
MKTPAASKLGRRYDLRPGQDTHRLKSAHVLTAHNVISTGAPCDWRPMVPPVRDQGQEGSCFAFATAALKEFNCARWSKLSHAIGSYLSPAYISWRTRLAEGTFPEDSGAALPDAMAVLQAWGACPEAFLPYSADPAQKGNAQSDVAARPYRVHVPCAVRMTADDLAAVLSSGRAVAIGFEVHESFEETGPDGMVPGVQPGEGVLGGHAVLAVGWEMREGRRLFVIRNSWGKDWGDAGHCYWPDSYLHHAFDAWTTAD